MKKKLNIISAMKHLPTIALIAGLSVANAATSDKPFVYCSEASPEGFNPQLYTSGTTFDVTSHIYDKLVSFKSGTTEVIPSLAEKWSISPDNKEYTFELRKNVKFQSNKNFQPTRDFNADDVVFTFKRQGDPNHPYYKVSGGNYPYYSDMGFNEIIKDVVKVDEHTVKFILSKPNAPFLSDLAMDFTAILSAEYADKMLKAKTPEKIDLEPIGTGSYKLVAYQKDAQVRFSANEQYWQGVSPQKTMIFSITPDATVRYQKMIKGECQAMVYPNTADIKQIKANKNLQVFSQPGLNISYIGYNVKKAPFDNLKFRQALDRAINKKVIIDAVFQGNAIAAVNPMPPTLWGYNKNIKDPGYNIEEAKKLLAESGVKNPTIKLWALPVSRPYMPNGRKTAEIIQADWAKIGVKTEIVTYEWGEYLKRLRQGEGEAIMSGWNGDNGDPDNFLFILFSCSNAAEGGGNYGKWCDQNFDKLIIKAQEISNTSERSKLYSQALQIFFEQKPATPIAHSIVYDVLSKQVRGYKPNALAIHNFYGVSLD